ncbi:hypothetical protein KAH27_06295 [bacterium]|nr:hypothetical protein [bacterium]
MRIIIYTFTLICVVVFIAASGCSRKQKSPAVDKYNQALELQENERYKDALRLFHKAVQIDPNHEDAYLQIASIYDDHLEDKDRAVEWYQKYLNISQNESQKQLVNKWLKEAKISAEEIKSGSKGDLAKLSPQVRAVIKKHVSIERGKIKQEYKAKEKSLIGKHKDTVKDIKEQHTRVKSENIELKDKLENLTVDFNASQKNSARDNIRNKLAGLLSSASKSKKSVKSRDSISAQKYIDIKTQSEEFKIQLSQERAKGNQLERQIISLDENIRKLKQLQNTSDRDKAYQKQIEELQDSNTEFSEKIKLLEDAAALAEQAKADDSEAEKDNEIRTLQNRISKISDENTKVLAEKKQAEQSMAQLQDRLDKLINETSNTDYAQKAIEENKRLRQQIARITSEFNEVSQKQDSAEQRNQELQSKIAGMKNASVETRPAEVNENFKDLSEEITAMQKTIQDQQNIIGQKNSQVLELITQNLNFQKTRENKDTDQPIKELNELLIQKNIYIQELTTKLNNVTIGRATKGDGLSTVEAQHVQVLSKKISELRKQLSEKEKSIGTNTNLHQKYKIAYDNLYSKFNDLSSKNKNLESEIYDLKSQLSAANKAILTYKKK